MKQEIKSVALIGLGAIGGYVAPKLHQTLGDEHFFVVASGERKQRLETQGCHINDKIWKFHILDPKEAKETVDLVIISVKYYGLNDAIEDLRPLVSKDTIFISLLNGVESEEVIGKAYPQNHILYSVIRVPSIHEEGKILYDEDYPGYISFGEKENKIHSPQVQAVDDLLTKANLAHNIPEHMLVNMWHKYMTNVSENLTSAIIKVPYGIFQISKDANHMRIQVAKEVIAVANAKGIALSEDDLDAVQKKVDGYPFYGKTSTAQDVIAGRKTEVDMFAGAMIRMGEDVGVPTPYSHMLYDFIKAIETWNDYKK